MVQDRSPGGGAKPSGAGMLVVVLVLVFAGMMLFGKRGADEPGAVEDATPARPSSGGATDPARSQKQPERAQGGDWSIDEVAIKQPGRAKSSPAPAIEKRDRRSEKSDWAIEEVPVDETPKGSAGAQLELGGKPGQEPEAKKTRKGDWAIEEVPDISRPATGLDLSNPKPPKTTKEGDWELEVD